MRAAALILLLTATTAHAAGQDVKLEASDGTALAATYYAASKPGPGVVLLHMCNSRRQVWKGLGERLAARGIHAIALDYRGYGGSGGARVGDLSDADRLALVRERWPGDVDAALAYLASRPGVDRRRIGAAGGSCGVHQAIQLARRHPEVKTLVLLAGGTDAAGEDFLARAAGMPILSVAARDDGGAVDQLRWLAGFSSNELNRTKFYDRGGHGTDLFPVHADLEPAIADWFEQHLIERPVRATAGGPPGPSARAAKELRSPAGVVRLRDAHRKGATALPPEGVINLLGYEALQAGRTADAIQLFELNVEAHPGSANAYDSLGDAHLAAGDHAKARALAQKALELVERDPSLGDAFKQRLRESARAKLAPAKAGGK